MKNSFEINRSVKFTADLKGVAVVNTKERNSLFIEYPEAAVWLVFTQGNGKHKLVKMLQAILEKNETETRKYINNCINSWKNSGLIK